MPPLLLCSCCCCCSLLSVELERAGKGSGRAADCLKVCPLLFVVVLVVVITQTVNPFSFRLNPHIQNIQYVIIFFYTQRTPPGEGGRGGWGQAERSVNLCYQPHLSQSSLLLKAEVKGFELPQHSLSLSL